MKRTPEQVTAELDALKVLAKRLPRAKRNLDTVIEALEFGYSVDQVYDEWDTEDTEFQYALDAARWLAGETEDKPSKGWDD